MSVCVEMGGRLSRSCLALLCRSSQACDRTLSAAVLGSESWCSTYATDGGSTTRAAR